MRGIAGGLAVIAVGLLLNDSVFFGQFTVRSVIFDALGVFFVLRGVVSVYRAKQEDHGKPLP